MSKGLRLFLALVVMLVVGVLAPSHHHEAGAGLHCGVAHHTNAALAPTPDDPDCAICAFQANPLDGGLAPAGMPVPPPNPSVLAAVARAPPRRALARARSRAPPSLPA